MSDQPPRVCRCAHPIVLDDTFACRWPPGTEVTWCLDEGQLPAALPATSFGRATTARIAIAAGILPWTNACGVTARPVTDPTQARVVIRFASIDGPWNVLGQTELPCSGIADIQHTMTLDVGEAWTPTWLAQVVMHEFGHALGLGHAPPGVVAVMAPIYNPALADLQPWDSAEAQARYGPPAIAPEPEPPPADAPPTTPVAFQGFLTVPAGPRELTFPPVKVAFPEAGDYEVLITVAPAGSTPASPQNPL